MIFQARTGLELTDAVVCGNCGHPIWDARAGDSCATCNSRERATACSLFLLNDFIATNARSRETFSLQ